MRHNIGAELTALSAPGGFGFGGSFLGDPFNQTYYGSGLGYGSPYYGSLYGRPPGYGLPPGYGVQFGPYILGQDPAALNAAATAPAFNRTGLVAELAPLLAPATNGVSVKKFLDDDRVLHIEICVDGQCYRQSMDLAPAIDMVLQKLMSMIQNAADAAPDKVVSTVDNAINEASNMIVGALVTRHIKTIAGSWLGDIGGAISSAVKGVGSGFAAVGSGVKNTFIKYKKPIGIAAGIAAAAGAALIPGVGPIAAPIAGKLANDIVQSAGGDAAATTAVTQATQQAKTDPAVAAALAAAQSAVATTTAAYHVQETAKAAAQGNNAAQKQIVQVATDAQNGDPAAKAVADVVANAMKSEWGADLWTSLTGRGPDTVSGQWYDIVGRAPRTLAGQWYDIIGCVPPTQAGQWVDIVGQSAASAIDDLRERARQHAVTKPGPASGVIIMLDGRFQGRGFRTLDDAVTWLDHVARNRGSFMYAAAYEKDSDGRAYIQAEEVGQPAQQAPQQLNTIRRDVATIY